MHILFIQKTTSVGSLKIVTETHQNAEKGSHNPLVQDGSIEQKTRRVKKRSFWPGWSVYAELRIASPCVWRDPHFRGWRVSTAAREQLMIASACGLLVHWTRAGREANTAELQEQSLVSGWCTATDQIEGRSRTFICWLVIYRKASFEQ